MFTTPVVGLVDREVARARPPPESRSATPVAARAKSRIDLCASVRALGNTGVSIPGDHERRLNDPSNEQLIELFFSESEGWTTVLMVNVGISTDERRDAQDGGWHGCFDELERVLADNSAARDQLRPRS
jgi:hypothetical protein